MFGYIKTDIPNLYIKDSVLYRSIYCGVCKGIGGTCGNIPRLSLSYDLAFLSAFFHNILDKDIVINREKCVMHWFIGVEVAKRDDITDKIAVLNTLLAYYKLNDDVLDSNKSRGKRFLFRKAYKKAVKLEPELDRIVKDNYKTLFDYEKKKGESLDISADSFGNMIREITKEILKDKSDIEVEELGYNLGKWIYLIDALDDFDKDKKQKEYNPFCLTYKNISSKKELLEKYGQEISFIFGSVLEKINVLSKKIKYNFNHDLTDNILQKGLVVKTKQVMEILKCKKTIKY